MANVSVTGLPANWQPGDPLPSDTSQGSDTGLDQPTITIEQSQSISNQTPPGPTAYNPPPTTIQTFDDGSSIQTFDDGSTLATSNDGLLSSSNAIDAIAPSSLGVGSPNDDNFGLSNTTSGTDALLNAGTNPSGLITPRPNVLDQYASYTYSLSWYLLTPVQFKNITNSKKINVSQWSLLVQSGGASIQQAGISTQNNLTGQTASAVAGRNKYFSLDYYLDDFEITTTLGGGGPATLTQLSFKITEPNGITLLPNLTNAVRDLYQESEAATNSAFYVMAVNFYGWDINGYLITDPTSNKGVAGATPGISNAVITRYYPFRVNSLHFKMANKAVEYQITGGPQAFEYAQTSGLGSIPYNIEITGETVGDILAGTGRSVTNTNNTTDGREATSTDSPDQLSSPIVIETQSSDEEVTALFNPYDDAGY